VVAPSKARSIPKQVFTVRPEAPPAPVRAPAEQSEKEQPPHTGPFKAALAFAGVVNFLLLTVPGWTPIRFPSWALPVGIVVVVGALIPALIYEFATFQRRYKDAVNHRGK
jgi:hypothetical protein